MKKQSIRQKEFSSELSARAAQFKSMKEEITRHEGKMRLGLVAMWKGIAEMQEDLAARREDLARIKEQVYPNGKALLPIPLTEIKT